MAHGGCSPEIARRSSVRCVCLITASNFVRSIRERKYSIFDRNTLHFFFPYYSPHLFTSCYFMQDLIESPI